MQTVRDLIVSQDPGEAVIQIKQQWTEMAGAVNNLLNHFNIDRTGKITSDTYKTKLIQTSGNPPKGAAAPTQVYLNNATGWQTKVGDEIYYNLVVPDDWVPGTGFTFDLHFYSPNTTAARYIRFTLNWMSIAIGETISAPGSSGSIDSTDILLSTTANTFAAFNFTTIAGSNVALGDHMFFRLIRTAAVGTAPATPADDPVVMHFEITYTGYVTDP